MFSAIKRTVKQIVEGRDSRWPKVRKEYLRTHPTCEACGTATAVEVHHVEPVSFNRSRELDPTNLLTLCESWGCHFRIGHSKKWTASNPFCREDAARQLLRIATRIERVKPPETNDVD